MKALIALEDGTCWECRAFAGRGEVYGELVFNTSMTGYQEILTDPSYHGQIVTLSYPLIGNYGINNDDVESGRPHAAGLVIGECSRIPSSWRSTKTLEQYLVENKMIGVDQVDTRSITLHIRSQGAMKCVISTTDINRDSLVEKARKSLGLVGRDLVSEVSTKKTYLWPGSENGKRKVAFLDCGCKYSQLRILTRLGCQIHVFNNNSKADDLLAIKPDGFFISNGPGDPEGVPSTVFQIRKIVETDLPTFGICFGHQMLGLAFGGKTYKLKFGHRGANQPVKELATACVEITAQNHGFCVDKDSLNPEWVETTHLNLNDQTSEGLRHKKLPVFSVQYHPEASPGPHDAEHLFTRFVKMMEERR